MASTRRVYQFRIALLDVAPEVWRRIQVPSTYSFWDLHVAIQDAMGWSDSHLHEFRVMNPSTGAEERIGIPDDDAFEGDVPILPGWDLRISHYFSELNPTAGYHYDFGDDWRHTVVFEGNSPRQVGRKYPCCLGGKQACPPEDCGGPPGYAEFLDVIADTDHEEHESTLTWVGGHFDPTRFNAAAMKFSSPWRRWKKAFLEE